MGPIFDKPVWQACGFTYKQRERKRVFRGGRAFSDAADCFEEMRADAEMWELWLIRWNYSDWEFRALIRRDNNARWMDVPYGSPYVPPPGKRPKT